MKNGFQKFKLSYGGMQYTFTILSYCLIFACVFNKCGWIRLFGNGISWKHKDIGLFFSERIGKKKYLTIGNYYYSFL